MNVVWLPTIDSTNSEALRRLPELPSGTVLAAREQTAGRGQRGNRWFSEPGANLTFSIVLRFGPGELPPGRVHELNYLASVTVVRFLGEEGVAARVKWPNDVYVGKRKISGMLIENTLQEGGIAAAVVGIGLNLNQRVFEQLSNATSLSLCTGKQYDVDAALERFLALFEAGLRDFRAGTSFAGEYSGLLFRKGERASYHDLLLGEEFTGVIEGVEPDGRLRIRSESGGMRLYRFKEVNYIL